MTNIVDIWKSVQQARLDAQKEVISENLVGIEFSSLVHECNPVVQLVRLSEELGLHEMEFKKGEW